MKRIERKSDSLSSELKEVKEELNILKKKQKSKEIKSYSNEDFNSFFYRFMNDSSFQVSRIKFPLKYLSWDIDLNQEIDSLILKKNWKHNSFYFNQASERTQIFDNFNLKFQATNERLLHWYGIETGGNSKYYFSGFNGQWFLIKKTDSGI